MIAKIYEDIKKLQPEDTLQFVLEAETEEQRSFNSLIFAGKKNKIILSEKRK